MRKRTGATIITTTAATATLTGITATGMEGIGTVGTGTRVIGILAQWSSWHRIDLPAGKRS
jgi:hypothetical protein